MAHMPKHTLYISPASAPCRSVMLHYGLLLQAVENTPEVEVVHLDLGKGEHLEEPFVSVNPRHCVPTLKTPFGSLWESRAIMLYFADLAQQQDPAAWVGYPRRVFQRATVHRLLDWDQGSFYKAVSGVIYPKVFKGEEPSTEALDALVKEYRYLDQHQLSDGRDWLVGEQWTVADISVAMGASMLELADLGIDDMPRVDAWLARVSGLDGWADVNKPFVEWCASLRGSGDAGDSDAESLDHDDAAED